MRPFNFELFALEHGIPIYASGYRQCREGWVQIECPFCHGSAHLGFNIQQSYFNCYSCGYHSAYDVLERLGYSYNKEVKERYSGHVRTADREKKKRGANKCRLPAYSNSPWSPHKTYLKSRGLNWHTLRKEYSIGFTNQITQAGYQWRIMIPVFFDHVLATFQARHVGESELRYKTCPIQNEHRPIKHCLYNYDNTLGEKVVVTEGVVDVWKLGRGAVATFGIDYSVQQVALLSEFKKVFVLFDKEEQAQKQAQLLCDDLSMIGVDTEIVTLPDHSDPGELTVEEGREVMEELLT